MTFWPAATLNVVPKLPSCYIIHGVFKMMVVVMMMMICVCVYSVNLDGALPKIYYTEFPFQPKGIYETRHENIMVGWPHGSRDVSGNLSPRNVPSPGAKRSNKAKAAKLGKSGSCIPGSNDDALFAINLFLLIFSIPSIPLCFLFSSCISVEGLEVPPASASSCRYDSSLGQLHSLFVAFCFCIWTGAD